MDIKPSHSVSSLANKLTNLLEFFLLVSFHLVKLIILNGLNDHICARVILKEQKGQASMQNAKFTRFRMCALHNDIVAWKKRRQCTDVSKQSNRKPIAFSSLQQGPNCSNRKNKNPTQHLAGLPDDRPVCRQMHQHHYVQDRVSHDNTFFSVQHRVKPQMKAFSKFKHSFKERGVCVKRVLRI